MEFDMNAPEYRLRFTTILKIVERKVEERYAEYDGWEWELTDLHYEQESGWTFISAHAASPQQTKGTHCYFKIACYGGTVHYYDSNVIDADKFIPVSEVRESVKNYFRHFHNKLQEL